MTNLIKRSSFQTIFLFENNCFLLISCIFPLPQFGKHCLILLKLSTKSINIELQFFSNNSKKEKKQKSNQVAVKEEFENCCIKALKSKFVLQFLW